MFLVSGIDEVKAHAEILVHSSKVQPTPWFFVFSLQQNQTKKKQTLRRVFKKLSVVVDESMDPKSLIKRGFQRSNSSQLQHCRNRGTASKKLGVKVTASKSPSKERS